MTRKSRIEPRKNLSFLSENDFWPKILPNAKNRQFSRTGKAESFWETFVAIRLFPLLKFKILKLAEKLGDKLPTLRCQINE